MVPIADALVYAVAYINLRKGDDSLDDDVGALESIADALSKASAAEQDALAAAAERALAAHLKHGDPREEFIRDYRTWMEDMFGEAWASNKRVGQVACRASTD